MPKIYLTDAFIERAKCPNDRDQIIYWDNPRTIDGNIRNGSQDGLGLRVTKQGRKAFIHAFFLFARRKRVVIGKIELGVSGARLKIINRNGQIADGKNPDADSLEVTQQKILSFRDLSEQYFELHLAKYSPATHSEYARLVAPWFRKPPNTKNRRGSNIRSPFPAFGKKFEHLPAESIKPMDVGRFINRIESDHVANSALKRLHAMFNWGIKMQLIDIRNPCSPFSQRKTIRRRPEYTPEGISNLAAIIFNPALEALEGLLEDTPQQRQRAALARGAIHKQNQQMLELCNFMGILFLTMARPNELKNAKFSHFDLNRLIWHKHNTKGIKLSKATYEYEYRSVPIHYKVAELVTKQKERWPDSEYVFPSHTDQTKPRNNFKTAMTRFKSLKNIPEHFQMYDIKRIAISLMLVEQGVSRETVSHYVDHKGNLKTTMIYDLGFVDPMRPVADKLGELLGV